MNKNCTKDKFQEHEGAVEDTTDTFMWQKFVLSQGEESEWNSKEDADYLKGYQLWERLINIALVPKPQPEILKRDPKNVACCEAVLFCIHFKSL